MNNNVLLTSLTVVSLLLIYKKCNNNKKSKYSNKAGRSIILNLIQFCIKLCFGRSEPDGLVLYTTEPNIADSSVFVNQKQNSTQRPVEIDSKRFDSDPLLKDEDKKMNQPLTCIKCQSMRVMSTQKPAKYVDEPMMVVSFCLNCGKRWNS